jgi:hypothetical protein
MTPLSLRRHQGSVTPELQRNKETEFISVILWSVVSSIIITTTIPFSCDGDGDCSVVSLTCAAFSLRQAFALPGRRVTCLQGEGIEMKCVLIKKTYKQSLLKN